MDDNEMYEVDRDKEAQERFLRWISDLNCIVENVSQNEEHNPDAIPIKIIENLQNGLQTDALIIPKWIQNYLCDPIKYPSDSQLKQTLDALFKNTSTSDNMKFKYRQLALPHVLAYFMNLKSVASKHMGNVDDNTSQNSSDVTMDVEETDENREQNHCDGALVIENLQNDIVTNASGNMDNVNNILRSYNECITGNMKDAITDMCKVLDTQFRYDRASMRDMYRLNKFQRTEAKRNVDAVNSLDRCQTSLDFVNSTGQTNSVFNNFMNNLSSTYDTKMKRLGDAQMEEERARLIYEAAMAKRQQLASEAGRIEGTWKSVKNQAANIRQSAVLRVDMEQFNKKSSNQRLTVLESLKGLLKTIAKSTVDTPPGLVPSRYTPKEAVDAEKGTSIEPNKMDTDISTLFTKLFSWWRVSYVGQASDMQQCCNMRIGLELVRLCKQLCGPTFLKKCPSVVDELESLYGDLQQQLTGGSKVGNNTQNPSHGPLTTIPQPAVPVTYNKTVVLYFDHVVHMTPDDHVESAMRTDTCVTAIRAQMLGSGKTSKYSRDLQLCCCNDIIAPPMWALMLTHCPEYLKQLWNLDYEAKLNDLLCPLEFDTEWESEEGEFEEDADVNDAASVKMDSSSRSGNSSQRLPFTTYRGPAKTNEVTEIPPNVREMLVSTLNKDLRKSTDDSVSEKVSDVLTQFQKHLYTDEDSSLLRVKSQANKQDVEMYNSSVVANEPELGSLKTHVITPFGLGYIVPGQGWMDSSMVKVALPWGVGTFNSGCIEKISTIVKSNSNRARKSASSITCNYRDRGSSFQEDENEGDSGECAKASCSDSRTLRSRADKTVKPSVVSSPVATSRPPAPSTERRKKNTKLMKFAKALVEEKGSQRAAAELFGLRREYLSQWFNGRATKNVILNVEEAVKAWVDENGVDLNDEDLSAGVVKVASSAAVETSRTNPPSPVDTNSNAQIGADFPNVKIEGCPTAVSDSAIMVVDAAVVEHNANVSTDKDAGTNATTSTGGDNKMETGTTSEEPSRKRKLESEGLVEPIKNEANSVDHNKEAKANAALDRAVRAQAAIKKLKTEEGDLLRSTCDALRLYLKYSQKAFAVELAEVSENKMTVMHQTTVSCWQNYRTTYGSDYKVAPIVVMWLYKNRNQLVDMYMGSSTEDSRKLVSLEVDEKLKRLQDWVNSREPPNRHHKRDSIDSESSISLSTSNNSIANSSGSNNTTHPREGDMNESKDIPQEGLENRIVSTSADSNSNPDQNAYPCYSLTQASTVSVNSEAMSKASDTDLSRNAQATSGCLYPSSQESLRSDTSSGVNGELESQPQSHAPSALSGDSLEYSLSASQLVVDSRGDSAASVACDNAETVPVKGLEPSIPTAPVESKPNLECVDIKVEGVGDSSVLVRTEERGSGLLNACVRPALAPVLTVSSASSTTATPASPLPTLAKNHFPKANSYSWYPSACELEPNDPKSALELHAAILVEMRRRGLSQANAGAEAKLAPAADDESSGSNPSSVGQPMMSRFLNKPHITPHPSSTALCWALLRWIRASRKMPDANSAAGTPNDAVQFCDICNRVSSTFSSVFGFYRHVAWCKKKSNETEVSTVQNEAIENGVNRSPIASNVHTQLLNARQQRQQEAEEDSDVTTDTDIDSSSRTHTSRYQSIAPKASISAAQRNASGGEGGSASKRANVAVGAVGSDTYVSSQSLTAALCAAGAACRAIDIVMAAPTAESGKCNTNAFVCTRPPGHHAGRYGCTSKCLTSGFCLFNNAAIALVYSRVKWGISRVAVVDIDVHFGNGTADILKNDPNAFFASVHMVYGSDNTGNFYPCCGRGTENPKTLKRNKNVLSELGYLPEKSSRGVYDGLPCDSKDTHEDTHGFYPSGLGGNEVSDNYMCVGVYPNRWKDVVDIGSSGYAAKTPPDSYCQPAYLSGSAGFRQALQHIIIPRLLKFNPELLIISAGFDGYKTDPLGGQLSLSTADYSWATTMLCDAMKKVSCGGGRVVSLLEGGYDTDSSSLGLARCVNSHVKALRGST